MYCYIKPKDRALELWQMIVFDNITEKALPASKPVNKTKNKSK